MHHRLHMAKRMRSVRIYPGDDGSDDDDAADPAGSANTVEYYTSIMMDYDETQLTRKIYAKATEQL
jgi:hypothetical protein